MNGKPMQFTQGAYRFKPDGSDFEYLTTSTNNTWGLGFSENFDVFGSTANNDPSWLHRDPEPATSTACRDCPTGTGRRGGPAGGAGYQSAAQFYAVALHDAVHPPGRRVGRLHRRRPGTISTRRASFPKEYWNRIAFINEPTAHIDRPGRSSRRRAPASSRATAGTWCRAPRSGSRRCASQVGPDGAVWVADWYNFIAQHNPTPAGFSVGKGAAYETSMRDHQRGRIYRIVYKGAPPAKKRSLSKTDPAGPARRARGRQHVLAAARAAAARRARHRRTSCRSSSRSCATRRSTRSASTAARSTRSGRCRASASWTPRPAEAYRAAVGALKHPAAGVRKAAAMVLPHTAEAGRAILEAGLLKDPDLHTRLAAVLALADMPASAEIGQALYAESQVAPNYSDKWLGRAFYIAATRQQKSFTAAYHADRNALPFSVAAGVAPDWEHQARLANAGSRGARRADWKEMQVPGNWETRGLPDFDGVVWFTRHVDGRGRRPRPRR